MCIIVGKDGHGAIVTLTERSTNTKSSPSSIRRTALLSCASFHYFFARHYLHTAIYHIHLMERSRAYLLFGVHGVGIAAYLGFCLVDGGSHLGVCRLAVEIFQFNDVGVLHVVVYLLARTEEDVGIAVLIVKFGDWTIEPSL